jgi:CheY-like chemotaxis protein
MKVLKLLIADDNADDARLIVHRARRAGYAVEWQRVETERAFAEALPGVDLVICDYSMPEFSPTRALAQIAERGIPTPFLLVSGSVSAERAGELMALGASGYVLKDQLDRLAAAIDDALARKPAG